MHSKMGQVPLETCYCGTKRNQMKVRELMTTDVETIGRNDELSVADDIMKMKRVRHLPVLEDGRLVGVVTESDFVRLASTDS